MGLSPLPTSRMSNQEKKASVLPYPEFESGKSPVLQRREHALSPMMATTQPITTSQQPDLSADKPSEEAMRMKELENMLNEAQSRAAVIEQEAYDKAYAAGEKAGLVLGEKRAEQMLETMENIVVQAEKQLQQLQQDAGHAVVDVAQAVTEYVIGELRDETENALALAADQAVVQFSAEHTNLDGLVMAVHPDDLNVMTRMCKNHSAWRIKADKSVTSGTCKLISTHQDALVDPKQAIARAVLYIRGQLLSHHAG